MQLVTGPDEPVGLDRGAPVSCQAAHPLPNQQMKSFACIRVETLWG